MANKYSNFEFQPYVSQYVDPQSVNVNKVLRERFDKNKANKDLIDRTLGSMEVLEGDKHLVEGSKNRVRETLTQYAGAGNWEDSGMVLDELVTSLDSDRGLQLAKQSQQNRAAELKFIREASMKGIQILDFGQGKANTHSSYNYDEDAGTYVDNVYEPMNQARLDYDQEMASLLKTIKPDTWTAKDGSIWKGISKGKASKTAEMLYGSYLASDAGIQDMRRLMEIDLPHDLAPEERARMAKNDIMGRMKALTHQYVYNEMVKSSPGTGTGTGTGVSTTSGRVTAALKGVEYAPFAMADKNLALLRDRENDPEAYRKFKENQLVFDRGVKESANRTGNTKVYSDYLALKESFSEEGDDRLFELLLGITTPTNDFLSGGGYVEGISHGWDAMKYRAIDMFYPGDMENKLQMFKSGSKASDALAAYENVRSVFRPQEANRSSVGTYEGISAFIDSERDQLHDEIADIGMLNRLTGTNYSEEDSKRINDLADNMYTFMVSGGGDELMQDLEDNGMSADMQSWSFSGTNEGQKRAGYNNKALSAMNPLADLDFLGQGDLKSVKNILGEEGGALTKWKDVKVNALFEADPLANIAPRLELNIGGKIVMAELKDPESWRTGFGRNLAVSMDAQHILQNEGIRQELNRIESSENREATVRDYYKVEEQRLVRNGTSEAEAASVIHREVNSLVINALLDPAGPYTSIIKRDKKNVPYIMVNNSLQPFDNYGIFEQFQKEESEFIGVIRNKILSTPRRVIF